MRALGWLLCALAACGGRIEDLQVTSEPGLLELRGRTGDDEAAFEMDNPEPQVFVEAEHTTSAELGRLRVRIEDARGEAVLNEEFLPPRDKATSRLGEPGRWRVVLILDRIGDPFVVRVSGTRPAL